jgi:hypothetical protein
LVTVGSPLAKSEQLGGQLLGISGFFGILTSLSNGGVVMGFSIQASGEMVYLIGEKEFRIPADLLVPGELIQNGFPLTEDDDADWLASFSADSTEGKFIWEVSYPVGPSAPDIHEVKLLERPPAAKVIEEMIFTAVEVDDDLAEPADE